MTREQQKTIWQSKNGRIIVVDTISYIDESNRDDVIIGGSHCGKLAGEYVSKVKPLGIILNDAGKGKDNAGIAGLAVLALYGIPAACVSCITAYIGNGMSTYEDGEISEANELAKILGITIGMPAKEAAMKMLGVHTKDCD